MFENLPKNIRIVLDTLSENGFEGYLVGGCVRDALRGKTPGDYDIATNALPTETQRVFGAFRVFATGLQHGTVTVVCEGENIEVTTFRLDGEYTDNRHPADVTFTGELREDLSRRDFTVNAMAWSPQTGLCDLFGGQDDLRAGCIRCVGDPDARFREDGLRILRALRFASVLDFTIDAATDAALRRNTPLLENISRERIYAELCKLLCGDGAQRVLLDYPSVFAFILPALSPMVGFRQNNPHHLYDVYTHTALCVANCPPRKNLRLAALFHDAGKPAVYTEDENGVGHFYDHHSESVRLARDALHSLKADNATIRAVAFLVEYHDRYFGEFTEKSVKRLLRAHSPEELAELILLMRADAAATGTRPGEPCRGADKLEAMLAHIRDTKPCLTLKDLAVGGRELLELGIEPQQIGTILRRLLDAVTDGVLPNEAEILLEEAKKP